jgi:hypothetical protein
MFHRVHQYEFIRSGGHSYRPRAYRNLRPDGTWEGWLVFFPATTGEAISPPGPETTERSMEAIALWAVGLTQRDLEDGLIRAMAVAEAPPAVDLDRAEYAALDAERLAEEAELESAAAEVTDTAARAAPGRGGAGPSGQSRGAYEARQDARRLEEEAQAELSAARADEAAARAARLEADILDRSHLVTARAVAAEETRAEAERILQARAATETGDAVLRDHVVHDKPRAARPRSKSAKKRK